MTNINTNTDKLTVNIKPQIEAEYIPRQYQRRPIAVIAVRWSSSDNIKMPAEHLFIDRISGSVKFLCGGDKRVQNINEGDWIVIDPSIYPKGSVLTNEVFRKNYVLCQDPHSHIIQASEMIG